MSNQTMNGLLFSKMLRNGAANLEAHCQEVNDLNVFPVPDGDTGLNMLMTVRGGVNMTENENLGTFASACAHGMLMSARGNSGVILSQLFKGIAIELSDVAQADAAKLSAALLRGTAQAYKAVVNPVEGTILTVCREAGEYAKSRLTEESSLEDLLRDYIVELHASLKRTPDLLPVLKQAGVVDSGAMGLLYIMEGMALALDGEILELVEQQAQPAQTAVKSSFNADSVLEFGYCTEFILQLQNCKVDPETFDLQPMIDYLSEIGNSLVALKDGDIVKIHVHTMTPALVVGYCQQFGEFVTFKMENMSVQHNELMQTNPEAPAAKEHKKIALVAVASGEGLEAQFKEMGADRIVSGGQTMNPSTEDFIRAFDSLSADHIIVLPNNGNILLAAKQAAAAYEASDIRVLETKSIAQGYAALSMFYADEGVIEDVLAVMEQAAKHVASCAVTYAIRDSQYEDVTIHNSDTICILNGKIVSADADRLTAVRKMLDAVEDLEECEVATVICGKDADENETEALISLLQEKNRYLEAGAFDGGQDVYSYILALE